MRFHLDHDFLETKYFCQILFCAFNKTVLSLCLTFTIAVLNSILYCDESF